MPIDNQDTSPSLILIRHKGGSKDRLNMELALLPPESAPGDASAASASATVSAIATSDIVGGGVGGIGTSCFTGETMVGDKRIDALKVGDVVPAFKGREHCLATVTDTFIHEVTHFLRVELANGTVLNVTPEHLVYDGEGFRAIGEMTDRLFDDGFRVVPIKSVSEILANPPVLVYNVTTTAETYFANGIAVHNLKRADDV